MCQIITLACCGPAVISHCTTCRLLYIWHGNLMLSFTPEEFNLFVSMTEEIDFEACEFPFADGTGRIIIKTPNPDIGFTFTQPEWQNFKKALAEATFMEKIYSLMQ